MFPNLRKQLVKDKRLRSHIMLQLDICRATVKSIPCNSHTVMNFLLNTMFYLEFMSFEPILVIESQMLVT